MSVCRRPGWSDEAGASLTELLVGAVISALVMTGVASMIFTSNDLRLRADDRSQLAADLAVVAMRFDRDGAMATSGAPARTQTTATPCSTPIDLGFQEGGASVRYRTVAGSPAGPLWLERVSGDGTRTLARNVSSCTWQAVQDGSGRLTVRMTIGLTGASGESLSRVLRAAPRLW
jgi:hypothetical protein